MHNANYWYAIRPNYIKCMYYVIYRPTMKDIFQRRTSLYKCNTTQNLDFFSIIKKHLTTEVTVADKEISP